MRKLLAALAVVAALGSATTVSAALPDARYLPPEGRLVEDDHGHDHAALDVAGTQLGKSGATIAPGIERLMALSRRAALPFVRPTEGPYTARFGVPGNLWRLGYHPGLDIAATVGTPIRAAGDGTVLEAGPDTVKGYGNYVKLDHGTGLHTLYAHMSRVKAAVGDRVLQGDVIGYVGMTGYTTGPHLHWEVRKDGAYRNPLDYLG